MQLAPTARVVPQLFAKTNWEALAPVTKMLLMDSAALPTLVKVTILDPLAVPTACMPNDRLAAVRLTTGALTPVPLSAIDCGDPLALSVMVIAAVNVPEVVGAK